MLNTSIIGYSRSGTVINIGNAGIAIIYAMVISLLLGIISLPLLYRFTSQQATFVIMRFAAVVVLLFVGFGKMFPEICQMLVDSFESMMQHNPAVLMVMTIVVEAILFVASYRIAKRVRQSRTM